MSELEIFAERVYISGWTYPIQWEPSEHQVDTSTVGQYTGLTDKNGRKIFEGDIVEIPHENELFVMAWDDDLARFICSGETVNFDFDSFYGNQIIVLGNIHDDSELLEVTDNGN